MTKLVLKSALAGALMLVAGTAWAGEYNNMCTMGLASGKIVKTDCSISSDIDGKTYCFGNEEAQTQFMQDPEANLSKADTYYKSLTPEQMEDQDL